MVGFISTYIAINEYIYIYTMVRIDITHRKSHILADGWHIQLLIFLSLQLLLKHEERINSMYYQVH